MWRVDVRLEVHGAKHADSLREIVNANIQRATGQLNLSGRTACKEHVLIDFAGTATTQAPLSTNNLASQSTLGHVRLQIRRAGDSTQDLKL
jgi:hypothetical protein